MLERKREREYREVKGRRVRETGRGLEVKGRRFRKRVRE